MIAAWRELARLPRPLWVLAGASLVNRMGTMALPFLTLYLTRAAGLSAGQAGAMLALYGAVALVAGPASGRLCDRFGAVRVMEGSLALSALALACYPLARGPGQVALMTALWAAAGEAFRPASLACVSELAPERMRKQAYVLHRLALNLGMSVGPALGGFLAAVSFPSIFYADAATSLLGAVVLHSAVGRLPRASGAPAEAGLPGARALSDRRLLYALGALLPVGVVFFQSESSMPLFLVRDLGLSEASYGLLFTLNTLMIVALEVPLNHATSGWSYRRALALGSFLYALGFGALGLARGGWHAAGTVAVWTIGEMILFPAMSAYVSEISPPRRRGEYMGLYTMTFSLAFMVGGWSGVLALEALGRWIWAACFALAAASTALFAALPDGEARKEV